MSSELLIMMPVYNEEEALGAVVDEWIKVCKKLDAKMLLINDGSKDKTIDVIKQKAGEYEEIMFIDRENKGHGPTIREGYQYAIDQGYKWVFQTDSDGQTNIEEFYPLWDNREAGPFQFGMRRNRGDGRGRDIISLVLRTLIYLIFGVYPKDANVPFRIMRTDKLKEYLAHVPVSFFLTNSLLSALILQKGEDQIHWFPITFLPRAGGVPSITWSRFFTIGLQAIKDFRDIKRSLK
ncbi:MAG: glycosyltransferase family 2 protein [Bacteriovoracaceae bacterium]|jgi:dolichol-phosphate mannosyltransferase|nr:glycosyltransferase family 2 protein [Bacteriovoracaceae bacterium]